MIARKSFLVFLNSMIVRLLSFVALFFILRYMGSDVYGMIGFGVAYVGLFSFIADIGFNNAHIKRVSEGRDLGKCIGTFIVIKLMLTSIMVIIVLLSVFFWKVVIGRGFESPEHEWIIYLFILFYVFLSLSAIPLNTFSARRETAKHQLPFLLNPIMRVPLAIVVALGSLGVLALAGSYVVGAFALLIAAILLLRGYSIGKFDKKIFKSYFKFALPIAVASSIAIISINVDKVMLQLFWNAKIVGYYFSVQGITEFLIVISTSVTVLLFPTLSEHHGKANHEEVRRLTTAAERYVSLIVVPCAVLFIVFSRPILNILNKEVAENASTILRIMAIYALTLCFYRIFVNQIIAIDRPDLAVKIGISMALTNIALNIVFIPKDIKSLGITLLGMGAEGAALATVISVIFGLTMVKIISRRLTGTKWNPKILLHLVAGVVMGGLLYGLNSAVIMLRGNEIVRWYEVGGACILGIGIYLAFLWLIKEFTKKDLRMFLSILSPKGMKHYVVSELRGKEKLQ